jgi:hypothetical protein
MTAIEEALAGLGFEGVFADQEELAREAQRQWWHRLLGRLDGEFDDDLSAVPQGRRLDVIRSAWMSQLTDMSGYLLLAMSCPASPAIASDRERYAGLLAMYAGRAQPSDSRPDAAMIGRQLIEELAALSVRPRPLLPRLRRRSCRPADSKITALKMSRVFSGCTKSDLVALSRAADLIDGSPGETLVRDARPGDWWWFVLDGMVDLVVDGQFVAQLHPGEGFGPEPRRVTHLAPLSMIASSPVQILVARRAELGALLSGNKRLARVITATPQAAAANELSRRHPPSRFEETVPAGPPVEPVRPRKVV